MQKNIPSGVKKPSLFIRFIKGTVFQVFVFFTTIVLLGVGYAAWTTINPSQGADGQPVTQTLMQGMINNLNDLNTRVQNVENGTKKVSGGFYQVSNNGCNKVNPVTGSTGCPAGYTDTLIYATMGLNTCAGVNDQIYLHFCM